MVPADHWKMMLSFVSAACFLLHGKFSNGNGPLFWIMLILWWWCFLKGKCNYSLACYYSCSNISHALWWLHHLLWNKISLLWPLLGIFAEEEGEADQVSCLRLCLSSVAELGSELKTCSCPGLQINLLHCLCLSVALTRKSWWRQCYLNILWEAHTLSCSSKMLLIQLV